MHGRALLALALFAGCGQHATPSGADMAFVPAFAAHDKVDVLFMLDNSLSTSDVPAFVDAFPKFLQALDTTAMAGHPASYHLGVVTSDLGAGLNTQNCKPGGDGAILQVTPDPMATVPSPAYCNGFSLGGGVRFLDYDQIAQTNNVVGGLSIEQAFGCMGAVGSEGCGFEHVLESPYRALHDDIPENAGFLRDDALLVVVLVTDEDDCSAPDDTDLFLNTPEANAQYGVLHSFRCTQWGISCTDPPAPLAPVSQSNLTCQPLNMADGGKLFDVQRYIDFFARPGGVKADPSDVILAAIYAPPTPVGVTITMPCADQTNTAACPILNQSCVNPTNSHFFGDPGVRIAAVVGAATTGVSWSLCDDDYLGIADELAQKIIARLK